MKLARLALTTLAACLASAAAHATVFTGYMTSDQHLLPGDALVSYDGKYQLKMKVDGSIARIGPNGEFWNPGKFGQELVFQWDGNLVLYGLNRQSVAWALNKTSTLQDYRLEISSDGALTALVNAPLSPTRTVIWNLPGAPAPTTPPEGPCGAGRTYQIYPVCIPLGTGNGSGMNGTILACSQSEAATKASRNGWRYGVCNW